MSAIVTLQTAQKLNKKKQAELRSRIQTDLFFLANNVLRAESQLELKECHASMCSFLPQCDPTMPMEYWSDIKERVLLSARGTLKSTILSAYVTQIILCNSNVRVMLICGNMDKANQLVDLVRAHLQHPVLATLFPEHQGLSKGNSFTTPARSMTLRDATVFGGSFRTINTGAHADFIFLDDAATELAHRTQSGIQKTIDGMDDLVPVLDPGGYLSFFGTRWAENDCPAIMFSRAADIEQQTGKRILECLELPAWQVKTGHENNMPLTENDVDLLWPEKLSWQFLSRIYAKIPKLFRQQYLLQVEPLAIEEPLIIQPITPELLKQSCTNDVPFDEIPVMNGDLADVKKTGTDLCGIVGGFYSPEKQILVITELINRKYEDPDVFLRQVWEMHCKFRLLNRVLFRVEEVRGASDVWDTRFRELNLIADFQRPDGTPNARDIRVDILREGIRTGKVKFDAGLPQTNSWRDVEHQFCNYPNLEHDDLIDSAAQLYEYCKTLTVDHKTSEILLPTRKEILWGNLNDVSDAINPYPSAFRPSTSFKIRPPDALRPPMSSESYSDPYYSRVFSTRNYERPL